MFTFKLLILIFIHFSNMVVYDFLCMGIYYVNEPFQISGQSMV